MRSANIPLKRVVSVRVSNVDKKTVDGAEPVRLCNYTDAYYRDIIRPDQEFMTATATSEQIAAFRLRPGDVVITKDSETAEDIGVPAYVAASAPDLVCGYHLAILRPMERLIHGKFLYWSMMSTGIREQLAVGATGVTRYGLRTDSMAGATIRCPGLPQQRAIANFLDAETTRIDALIVKRRRQIGLLEERFRETTRVAVTDDHAFIDPLHVQTYESAVGWRQVKLSWDLVFGSGTTPLAGDVRFYGEGTPWIVTGNLRDDDIIAVAGSVTERALAEYSALRVHPAGSLVVAMYGATVGRLGMTTAPAAVNQACCVIHGGERVSLRFLFLYLLTHRDVLLERSVGAGQPNISQEILRSIKITVPNLEEQERIAAQLFNVRKRTRAAVQALNLQIALLQEHRQALVTAAVDGELDIPGVAA